MPEKTVSGPLLKLAKYCWSATRLLLSKSKKSFRCWSQRETLWSLCGTKEESFTISAWTFSSSTGTLNKRTPGWPNKRFVSVVNFRVTILACFNVALTTLFFRVPRHFWPTTMLEIRWTRSKGSSRSTRTSKSLLLPKKRRSKLSMNSPPNLSKGTMLPMMSTKGDLW